MNITTASVFPDNIPRRQSRAYESINEYLKKLDLGRVKPGFNSQTNSSLGLWEDSVKKGKAFGFYKNPGLVVGSFKSLAPYALPAVGTAATLSKEQKGGVVAKLSQKEIDDYIKQGYIVEEE